MDPRGGCRLFSSFNECHQFASSRWRRSLSSVRVEIPASKKNGSRSGFFRSISKRVMVNGAGGSVHLLAGAHTDMPESGLAVDDAEGGLAGDEVDWWTEDVADGPGTCVTLPSEGERWGCIFPGTSEETLLVRGCSAGLRSTTAAASTSGPLLISTTAVAAFLDPVLSSRRRGVPRTVPWPLSSLGRLGILPTVWAFKASGEACSCARTS